MVSLEELEAQLKVKRAEKRLAELETAFQDMKNEVSQCETLEDLIRVMSRQVAKVNNARAVIKHAQE